MEVLYQLNYRMIELSIQCCISSVGKLSSQMQRILLQLLIIWRLCILNSALAPRNETEKGFIDTRTNGNQTQRLTTNKENLKQLLKGIPTSPVSGFTPPVTHKPTTHNRHILPNDSYLGAYRLKYEQYVEPGRNVSRLLETVFARYDKRIRPFYGVRPLAVGLDMLILSFGELREARMEYSVDMYLGQFWQDPRLAFGLDRTIILGGESLEKLWVPDTFFINSVESKLQKMLFTNKKVWISLKNGTLMLSTRLITRNSCKFDLRNYPLDQQTCHLAFESFSYEDKDLVFSWRKKKVGSDIMVYDRHMAQFDIVSAKRYLKHGVYHSGTFSGLTATIVFQRRAAYYIFQIYIPCICITALSWVSFWIKHEAVPARVALSITTVLTISYTRGSVNTDMPRVSYLKSIDYFLLGSFVFIFMTLIEYVLVLKYSQKETYGEEKKASTPSSECNEEVGKKPMIVTVTVGNKSFNFKSSLEDLENGNGIKLQERPLKRFSLLTRAKSHSSRGKRQVSNRKRGRGSQFAAAIRNTLVPKNGVHWLDKYSRYIFPIGYIAFLTVYFTIYTTAYNK